MNKKSLLGLIIFAGVVTGSLFVGADLLIGQNETNIIVEDAADANDVNIQDSLLEAVTSTGDGENSSEEASAGENIAGTPAAGNSSTVAQTSDSDLTEVKPIDTKATDAESVVDDTGNSGTTVSKINTKARLTGVLGENIILCNIDEFAGNNQADCSLEAMLPASSIKKQLFSLEETAKLICDSEEIDYKAFIPDMIMCTQIETALDITNPSIEVEAEAAILFDATTKEVLFYKNPVQAMFPASTAKLLTSLVALDWCSETEEVTIGDEITMIASDSTRAYLEQKAVLSVRNLLEGMLVPSGNDAAYAVAAYVGRKSLGDIEATKEEAVNEFIRLMNQKAEEEGVINSCFKTPDGYDAVGQYTTAYDMGLIGIAAAGKSTITEIAQKSIARNIFPSGEDITWECTNKLIKQYSGQYYSYAIGLKTGTSTMAGRCLVAAAEKDGRKVVCVVMDSSSAGRWEDAIAMLEYGLE
ncbi:MAG: serine hydrolase [Mobilitalea sp.]